MLDPSTAFGIEATCRSMLVYTSRSVLEICHRYQPSEINMLLFIVLHFLLVFSINVHATSETITYNYDTSGKLTDIVGDTDFTIYKHDLAGNQVSNNNWLKRTVISDALDLQTLEIADAKYIDELVIMTSGVTNLAEISQIDNLTNLNLRNAGISLQGIDDLVSGMTQLVELDIGGNNFTSVADIQFLEGLDNLIYVELGGSSFYMNYCFSFFSLPKPLYDADLDGADDCTEYLEETNLWNDLSHPTYSRHFNGTTQFSLDLLADMNAELPYNEVREGVHPIWSDFDQDGDLDVAVYIHGANEQTEVLSCSFDCDFGYYGDWQGKLMFYQLDHNNMSFTRTSLGLTTGDNDRPTGDIRNAYPIDYNNDGHKDLLLVTTEINLYENQTNMDFIRVTDAVGLNNITEYEVHIVDANMDGYLDLFFGENHLMVFNPQTGLYEDKSSDISSNNWSDIVAALDIDSDGMIDLVSKNNDPNYPVVIHKNSYSTQGGISFTDTQIAAVNFPEWLTTKNWEEHVEIDDYDNDGDGDIIIFETRINDIGNGADDYNGTDIRIIRNATDTTVQTPVLSLEEILVLEHEGGYLDLSRGGTTLDYNNDSKPDILKVARSTLRTHLYKQIDQTNYDLLTDSRLNGFLGNNFNAIKNDIDQDGYIDLIIPRENMTKVEFIRNLTKTNNGFTVKLVGDPTLAASPYISSKDAHGAKVTITDTANTNHSWEKSVLAEFGRDSILHFGVANADFVDIEVHWPSGRTQTLNNFSVANNKYVEITETEPSP